MAELKLLPQAERLLSGSLSAFLASGASEMTVDNPPEESKLPTFIELEPNSDNAETVRATAVVGNVVTIERGVFSGGTGTDHTANSTYKQQFSQKHWDAVVNALESGWLAEDSSYSLTKVNDDTIRINSVDRTAYYTSGRRIRMSGSIEATVISSAFTGGNTVIDVKGGTVPTTPSSIELMIGPNADPLAPARAVQEQTYVYAEDTGSADAYEVSLVPIPSAYVTGMVVAFKADNANTGASTVNVNSLGTKTIKKQNDQDLEEGDIEAGQIVVCVYDGTNFQMLSQVANPVTADTAPQNLLRNGNFINNATNGYGNTPDDWTNSSANPIQGGFPELTKQQVMDILGIDTGDIEALYPLNGNFTDLSDNGYNLTSSGSPTDENDGLMAQGKGFTSAGTKYAITSNATNVRMAGNQTFVAFIRPTSVSGTKRIMAVSDATPTNYIGISLDGARLRIDATGLTENNLVHDVTLETGKYYMVVGIYDNTNDQLRVWVNGVKKQVTVTGSHTAGTGELAISRLGSYTDNYFDGIIQGAMLLSVALTDAQVKRLWAYTTYRGQKIRRATTDAYLSQDLSQDLVERLRGKTITLTGSLYQAVASTAQIAIYDGTETASDTDATVDEWLEKSVTKTISATATQIQVRIKHSTTDGNSWFREMRLYEGASPLPFEHSKDDTDRFGELVNLNPMNNNNGYGHLTRRLLFIKQQPQSGYVQANNTNEQTASQMIVPLPIISRKCLVKVYVNAYVTTPNGNNTFRIRMGTSTTYTSNTTLHNSYIGGAKTVETFFAMAQVEADLSTQQFVSWSAQADANPTGLSISGSGNRTSIVVEVYG